MTYRGPEWRHTTALRHHRVIFYSTAKPVGPVRTALLACWRR